MIYGQLLAGQFLSLKAVKQNSLRIDRDDLVLLRPCSSAASQNFIHVFSLAMWSAYCRDWWFSDISRVLILAALIFRFLSDNSDWLRTLLVNSPPSFDLRNWHCLTRFIDITSDAAMELKTWQQRESSLLSLLPSPGTFTSSRKSVLYSHEVRNKPLRPIPCYNLWELAPSCTISEMSYCLVGFCSIQQRVCYWTDP